MALKVETILANITVGQYAGQGQARTSIESIANAARAIEELGFDGLTTPETGHDPFIPLVIAAEHTSRVTLGTNVAIAFPRSPMVVAQTAWDLQDMSGGRFRVGLGTQVKGHNERRYSTPWTGPAGPRMREYVQCLQAIFQTFQNPGAPQYFEGEHYRFTMMPPFFNPGPIEHGRVPVYISGLNPYMARLAGELCDGLRLHPLATLPFTKEVVLPAIEAGATKAGRKASDVDLVGSPFIVTGKDEGEIEAAKRATKQMIAFYASTRTYHSVLEFHGWAEAGRRLHQLSIEGKWGEMMGVVTDEMLAEFAVIAPYDELASRLKERWGSLLTTLFLGLPPGSQEAADIVPSIIESLHRG
ncbi:MAG: TIGR03617 family F420-dependent LLM class oxidoreductase [Dehalococcoidia bacterium]